MGQAVSDFSLNDEAENDMQQIQSQTSSEPKESAINIYNSIYQQTSTIELDCSEDLFGSENIWSNLPLDAIKYIFEFLPFSDLFNTSTVCKKFNSLCWKHLTEIDISKESKSSLYVNDQVFARVVSIIPNIKRLSLCSCRLLTSESLELITFQTNLQSLDLSYVTRLDLSCLCKIADKCTNLKRLVLAGGYRYLDNGKIDKKFPFFPKLEVFVFKRPHCMTLQFRDFLRQQCKTLTGLNIDSPQNTTPLVDAEIISDILSNEYCREQLIFLNLNLREDAFTHSTIKDISNLQYFKKLKGLSIATLVNEETCKMVIGSIGNQLEYLNICRTGPSKEITTALLTHPMRNLKILSLHKNEYQVPNAHALNIEKILEYALDRDGDLGKLQCFEFCYVRDNDAIDEYISKFNPYFKNIREWKRKLGFEDY